MHSRRRFIPIILLLFILGIGYYLYSTRQLPVSILGVTNATNNANIVSGFIEGEDVNIASEVSGRVESLTVDEGDQVTEGQELIHLDRTVLDAQIAQAQAALATAQSQLAQLKNGPRESDVNAAQAALDAAQRNYDKVKAGPNASDLAAAQAALKAAQQAYDKLRAGATTADLNAALAALSAAQKNYEKVKAGPTADELAQLKAQADNAKAALDQAQAAYDRIGGATNPFIAQTPQSKALQQATNNYNAALAAYNNARTHPTANELAAAQAQVQQAQAALAKLKPDAAQLAAASAQVQQAQAAVDRLTPDAAQLAAAQAQVQQAQAALERLTPTADSIAVAENQVKQAEAALAVLQAQSSKLTLKSPVAGIVARRAIHAGEVAAPGTPLLTITNLTSVKLTIYVPETQIGSFKPGDEIDVQVDSFPERTFKGHVVFIASQAEFTPRNVQTKAERVNTVFAVKLQIPNSDFALKPGMPADALLK